MSGKRALCFGIKLMVTQTTRLSRARSWDSFSARRAQAVSFPAKCLPLTGNAG